MQESENKYQMLFNAIDEGFCIIEMIFDENEKPVDYRFLEVNPSFEKQTGLIDAQGRRMKELAPEHEKYWFEIYGKVALTGKPVRFVDRAVQLHRWFDVYAFRVGQPKDRQVAILFNDITKRKQIEKEINLQSEIMKNISEGINLIRVKDEVIVFTNQKFEKMFGYSSGELIGKHVSILNAPGDKSPEEVKQDIVDTLKSSGEWHGEILNRKKNGDSFWCYVNISEFDHPDFGKVYISVHTNINKRRQAEDSLRQALDWQEAIFEGSRDAIFISDQDSRFIAVNKAACDLTGFSREKLLKMRIPDIHDKKDQIAYKLFHKRIFAGEEILSEAKVLRSDGTKIDTEFNNRCVSIGGKLYMHTIGRNITERKLAEKTLIESEEKFRQLSEKSVFGISIIQNGIFVYVNKSFATVFGYSTEEITGRLGPKDLIFQSDIQTVMKRLRRRVKGGSEDENFYCRGIRKDGTWIYIEVNGVMIDFNGKPAVMGTLIDITERKLAEDALQDSEKKLKEAQELGKIGSWEFDVESKKITWSDQTFKLYHRNPALGPPTAVEEAAYYSTEQVNKIRKYAKCAIEEGIDIEYDTEVMIHGSKNVYFSVRAQPVKNANGKVTKLFGTVQNITERKNAEEKLRISESVFRSLFENSLMGISQANPGGKLIRINQAYAEMYGYLDVPTMLKEISNNTVKLYVNPFDRVRVLEFLDKKGFMEPAEFELIRRNGENFWALVSAKQVRDNTGKLLYLQAEHINITELKNAEKKLKDSQNKYRNLSHHLERILEKERSAIAMNLHDDLGQKLTAIDLELAWIKGRIGVQSPSVKKKLNEIRLMINEIVESIKEISSFLRPAILFDLGLFPAISSLLGKFEKTSGIRCNFQSGTEEINIDNRISLIIYRVIQEALTNIARHSGASNADITISIKDNIIVIVIKDNGKGVDDASINSINSMGITGIKERVKSIHGKVQIKGGKDFGTCIMVSIPLNKFDND